MDYASIQMHTDNIVVVTFADFDPTEEQFERYLSGMLSIYEDKQDLIFLLDGTKAKYLSSKYRIRQGQWLKENKELIQRKCLKHIYVINNAIVKFILHGIFLVQKPYVDYSIETSLEEALSNAQQCLEEAQVVA